MRKILSLFAMFSVSYSLAQSNFERCGAENIDKAKAIRIEKQIDYYSKFITNHLQGADPFFRRDIKVYVFVDNAISKDVTDETLAKQIQVLNQAYSYSDSDFSISIRFTLAQVERVEFSTRDLYYDSSFLKKMHRGGKRDLNIFITKLGSLLGFAKFPWDYARNSEIDSVTIDYRSLPGGSNLEYNLGHTATHEVGHWLGLYHTFQDGCSSLGDRVADTVAHGGPTYGCVEERQACDGLSSVPIENFMNYSDDACMNRFTRGQFERIMKALILFR